MEVSVVGNKWFVLRAVSGKEKKVKQYLEFEIDRSGWQSTIVQVLIPTEKVYKIRKGKKVTLEKNYFPGYIFLEINEKTMSKDIVQEITSMTNVIGFLTDEHKKLIPMRQAEVNRMLGKVDEMMEASENAVEPFIVGETVKIIDGPFNDFNGVIEEVYDERKKIKVMVKIFGRSTPVELNFVQVEKVQ